MSNQTEFRTFRETKGKTLDETAKIFGVDRKTILRWEQGKTPLPVKRLDEIEAVTGIPRTKLRPDIFKAAENAA